MKYNVFKECNISVLLPVWMCTDITFNIYSIRRVTGLGRFVSTARCFFFFWSWQTASKFSLATNVENRVRNL